MAEFKQGRQSVVDEHKPGRPSTATTEENIDFVLDTVMEDRRLSCHQVADRIGISLGQAQNILQEVAWFIKSFSLLGPSPDSGAKEYSVHPVKEKSGIV